MKKDENNLETREAMNNRNDKKNDGNATKFGWKKNEENVKHAVGEKKSQRRAINNKKECQSGLRIFFWAPLLVCIRSTPARHAPPGGRRRRAAASADADRLVDNRRRRAIWLPNPFSISAPFLAISRRWSIAIDRRFNSINRSQFNQNGARRMIGKIPVWDHRSNQVK